MKNKDIKLAFLTVLTSIVFTLAGLEVIYRFASPSFMSGGVIPRSVGKPDDMLGWSYRPDTCAKSRTTGKEIEYCFNEYGFRDEPIPVKKPRGEFRIVLVGDSRTVGFGVPIEKHFSRIVEGYFKNVQVINMGVAGYGHDQMALMYELNGQQFDPDLVVAYISHPRSERHMFTRMFGKDKPRFQLENGALRLINQPVKFQAEKKSAHEWLREHFGLYYFVTNKLNSMGIRKSEKKPENIWTKDFTQESFDTSLAIFERLKAETNAYGVDILVLNQSLYLHREFLKRGISTHYIAPAMESGKTTISDTDTHPDEAGNGILAWELASTLVRQKLIPEQNLQQNDMWEYYLSQQ